MDADPRSLRTTYLGQFEEERAEVIAGLLDQAEISWFAKQTGRFTRFFFADAWGVRLFVDASRIEEASALVSRTVDSDA